MRYFFLSILFIISILIQVSFVTSLPQPFVFFPFHLIISILVLHKIDKKIGLLWFVLSGFLLMYFGFNGIGIFTYILIGVAGFFMVEKIFTTRSIYALEGLGLSLFILSIVIELILSRFNNSLIFKIFLWQIIFIVIGLYFSSLLINRLEKISANFVISGKKHV